jgi:hypothetical protein
MGPAGLYRIPATFLIIFTPTIKPPSQGATKRERLTRKRQLCDTIDQVSEEREQRESPAALSKLMRKTWKRS